MAVQAKSSGLTRHLEKFWAKPVEAYLSAFLDASAILAASTIYFLSRAKNITGPCFRAFSIRRIFEGVALLWPVKIFLGTEITRFSLGFLGAQKCGQHELESMCHRRLGAAHECDLLEMSEAMD